METLYFDYNATTPAAPEVRQAMEPYLTGLFGNPSSFHRLGKQAALAVRDARREAVSLLGAADENEIVFTSGGTESNNTALRSALNLSGKKEIITSQVEHSSVRKLCSQLKKENYLVREIGVDHDGNLDLEELRQALTAGTALVSLMMANNETGVIFPLEEIGKMLRERGILFHVDAVQAAGKIEINMKNLAVDFLSLSAHKFYGPKGAGVLYVRGGAPFQSLIFGGSQERGRRAGTENVPGIAGLGAAARLVRQDLEDESRRLCRLRDQFENQVLKKINAVSVNGGKAERLPNTSSLCIEGADAEAMLIRLDEKGICVSSGSACMSGSREPSHVLKAMGLSDDSANSSLRFSFGRDTKETEIDPLVEALVESVNYLRSLETKAPHIS